MNKQPNVIRWTHCVGMQLNLLEITNQRNFHRIDAEIIIELNWERGSFLLLSQTLFTTAGLMISSMRSGQLMSIRGRTIMQVADNVMRSIKSIYPYKIDYSSDFFNVALIVSFQVRDLKSWVGTSDSYQDTILYRGSDLIFRWDQIDFDNGKVNFFLVYTPRNLIYII